MPKLPDIGSMVLIEWNDAFDGAEDWYTGDPAELVKQPCRVLSMGFLVAANKHQLAVTATQLIDKSASCHIMVIPRVYIEKITVLKEKRS